MLHSLTLNDFQLMAARLFGALALFVFSQTLCIGQARKWAVSDTAWANQIFQRGYDLTDSESAAERDTAWALLNQVLDVYASTVGLYFEVPYDALRMKAYIRYYQSDFKAAIPIYHQCLEVGKRVYGPRGKPLGSVYDYLGGSYGQTGEFDRAIHYSRESLETRLKNLGRYHYRVAETYQNIATSLHFRGDPAGAVENYLESLEIYEFLLKQGKAEPDQVASTYRNIAISLAHQGDMERAIAYLHLGLKVLTDAPTTPEIEKMKGMILRDLGGYYSGQGDEPRCVAFYEKAVAHFQALGMDFSPEIGLCYTNLALAQVTLGNFPQQEFYVKKALHVWDTLRQYELPGYAITDIHFVGSAFRSQGEIALRKGQLAAAKAHTIQAIQWAQRFFTNEMLYSTQLQLAHIYALAGQPDSAEIHFALAAGGKDWKAARQFWSASSAPGHWALFHFKQAQRAGDLPAMQRAWQEWQKFEQFLLEYRSRLTGNETRNFLVNAERPNVRAALAAALHLHRLTQDQRYLRDAFLLSEKMRSLVLFEGLQESRALRFGSIPDSLLARDRDLRLDIAWVEKQIFLQEQEEGQAMDSSLLDLSTRLFQLKKQAETLQKTLETDYPGYYGLKYNLQVEDVASVQRDLLYPDMALVEYFTGDSTIYIFTVQKNDYSVLELKKDFPLETWVAQLRTGLTAFHTDPTLALWYDSLASMYAQAASNIYQKLVAPVAARLPKHVVFVPDGVLGYVPFEALLVEKPANPARWNTHRYLLNDHIVSYCYSATLLREMRYRRHRQQPTLDFLGFAPQYDGDTALLAKLFPYANDMRKGLQPLPHSGEEVFRSARLLGGQSFVGAEATEAKFVEMADQARILHLATHGQANDRSGDYCFLAFEEREDSLENELLYARDIYNLQLNADLVTLSACETGIGELQGGEGIISLARAFAYAGAKGIVTSLWSVSDAKTKDLMVDFYKNLRSGALKDDALRQAKLDYLKRNRGQAAHPFFWAGFIGIGDMAPVRR